MHAFADNDVVLPIIVLTELEAKRHHPDLGWAARTALRTLEELREEHGSLTEKLPIGNDGGTVRVEINHKDDSIIPEPLREANNNDHRILTVAATLAEEGDEVLPLTYIRGRTLSDTFVIIDEAQNLERSVLLTALSRLGEGSRAVLTHDVAQRDNLRVGRFDGISSVISSLRGHPLFAHVSLTTSERSEIAALVSTALDY